MSNAQFDAIAWTVGVVALFWVMPTVQSRKILKEKGYDGLVGVLLGLFLGLLGLLIAALLPYKPETLRR